MKTELLSSNQMRQLFLSSTYEHELSIACGRSALENLKASLAHAKALLDSRRFDSVIYINVPFGKRRFTDVRREVFPKSENNPAFEVLHMQHGRVGPDFYRVEDDARRAKGKVAVIVNSWEMASSCYRYKEQLLFAIHALVCCYEVTVIVYSQAREGSVKTGMLHRSGLGKLPIFAQGLLELPEEEEEATASSSTASQGESSDSSDGLRARPTKVKSAQPSGSKMKELRYADLVKEEELQTMSVAT